MAEIAAPPVNSYDLTVETKINIDELIYLLNYDDMPMLGARNADGIPTISSVPVDNTIFYWLEQDMPVPRSALNAAITDVATSIPLVAGGGVSFAVGDLIRIEAEVLQITAIATDTLTCTRGAVGTTAAAHAINLEVIGLGTYLDEGDVGTQQFRGRDKFSNYTQIFTSEVIMTRTGQVIPKYGVPSELGNLTAQVLLSEGIVMEQSLLYGVKHQTAPRRSTGGLSEFLANTVNNAASGDWLTIQEIEERQQTAYDLGGMFDRIVARPKNFKALNNAAGSERVRTVIEDPYRGRQRATSVVTEFGECMLHRNRYVNATDAFGVNTENIIRRVMQPMVMQPLAKTDDRDKWMFVSELGWEVKGQRHMVRWTGLDNTAPLPSNLV